MTRAVEARSVRTTFGERFSCLFVATGIGWLISGILFTIAARNPAAIEAWLFWGTVLFAIGWALVGLPLIAAGDRLQRVPYLLLGVMAGLAGVLAFNSLVLLFGAAYRVPLSAYSFRDLRSYGLEFAIITPTVALYRLFLDQVHSTQSPAAPGTYGRKVWLQRPLLTVLVATASGFAIYRLFESLLPPQPMKYDLTVEFERLEAADGTFDLAAVDGNNNLGLFLRQEVTKLGLRARARGAHGLVYYRSGRIGDPSVHILLLALEPVLSNAELPIPSDGSDVLYLLRNGRWDAYPQPVAHKAKEAIELTISPRSNGAFSLRIKGFRGRPNGFEFTPPHGQQ